MYGEKCIEFWWGKVREADHLEDPDADIDNIKMDLQEVGWGTDWIDPAQNRSR
jgi:hypothetical protein